MRYLDLQTLKEHCRAADFTNDDALLSFYGTAAEDYVANFTNRTLDELAAMSPTADSLPAAVTAAALLVAGHLYNQREGVGSSQLAEVPMGVAALLRPYERLT